MSDQFADHATDALREVDANAIPDELDLTIEQRILDGDDVADRYVVIFSGGTVRVGPTEDTTADIVISQDVETARAIQSGTTNAQSAYLTGRLTIDGDVDKLLSCGASLQTIVAAMEPR